MANLTRLGAASTVPAVIIIMLRHAGEDFYLDAATGSIIIQVLIGFFAGALLLLKIYWNRIRNFLKRLFSRKNRNADLEE